MVFDGDCFCVLFCFVAAGDITVIVPDKLVAFSGPADQDPLARFSPSHYCEVFRSIGVSSVVRLNSSEYDPQAFLDAGIQHTDMYFPDGCAPSLATVAQFLALVEATEGIVAVHCRAGLGRTGTCIALYLIKHLGFPAEQAVAWVRMCRPGSIVGGQYHALVRLAPVLAHEKQNDPVLGQAAQREAQAEAARVAAAAAAAEAVVPGEL